MLTNRTPLLLTLCTFLSLLAAIESPLSAADAQAAVMTKDRQVLSAGAAVTVSGEWAGRGDLVKEHVSDGDLNTIWGAPENSRSGWVQIDLGAEMNVDAVLLDDRPYPRIRQFAILAKVSGKWISVADGTTIGSSKIVAITPTLARLFRVVILEATDVPVLAEFQLLGPAGQKTAPDYSLADPDLKLVPIDSDPRESFISLTVDGAGRLFAGAREGLFVYEPAANGLYQPRRELYRFPKDSWVYDIAVRGNDLYVVTQSAIYLFTDGVTKRDWLKPQRLLWGSPAAHPHQGMHSLTFGPDGDLYIATGDEAWYYGDFKRPDHWGYWTLFHGPDATPTTYVGAGGVLRMSPDGRQLTVIAGGIRNSGGLVFDHNWNLYSSDNDHESMPAEYVPGRLLHVTPHAYFSWPRGWMPEKQPWRSDLLQTMTPNLGRFVPVDMSYYDDTFLPEKYRHTLSVARWCTHALPYYPLKSSADTFATNEQPLLIGKNDARPVGVAAGRGGRLFAAILYMAHNDGSPVCKSDIVMITRAGDTAAAPFESQDDTKATPDQLFTSLASPNWSEHFRAHVEITRRGQPLLQVATHRLAEIKSATPDAVSLLWLAAADGSDEAHQQLLAFTHHADPILRDTAVRALARFGAGAQSSQPFLAALDDADPHVRHAAIVGLFDQTTELPFEKIVAAASDSGSYIRQTAAFLLARRASVKQIVELGEDSLAPRRSAGVLAAGFRLTVPSFDQPLPAWWPLDVGMKDGYAAHYAEGVNIDLAANGARVGVFTMADAWAKNPKSEEDQALFAMLERRMRDADTNIAKQAALFLRLLKDPRSDALAAQVLGISGPVAQATAIKGAVSTGTTEFPPAFRNVDWPKLVATGKAETGKQLFQARGCFICHSIRAGDAGGGGPSLAGAGSRFNLDYLVESVLTPNKVVAPIFRWTVAKLKNGTTVTGLITSETADDVEFLQPSAVRVTVKKDQIVSREIQERSPMPEGLIQTPDELRDLLAFLLQQKEAGK